MQLAACTLHARHGQRMGRQPRRTRTCHTTPGSPSSPKPHRRGSAAVRGQPLKAEGSGLKNAHAHIPPSRSRMKPSPLKNHESTSGTTPTLRDWRPRAAPLQHRPPSLLLALSRYNRRERRVETWRGRRMSEGGESSLLCRHGRRTGSARTCRARRPDPALDVLRLVGQRGTLTGQSQHGRKRAERPPAMGEVSEGNQAWHRLLAWWQGMVRQSICLPGSPCLRRRLGALAKSSKFASFVVLAIIRSIPGFFSGTGWGRKSEELHPCLASRVAKWDRLPAALARRLAAGQ